MTLKQIRRIMTTTPTTKTVRQGIAYYNHEDEAQTSPVRPEVDTTSAGIQASPDWVNCVTSNRMSDWVYLGDGCIKRIPVGIYG